MMETFALSELCEVQIGRTPPRREGAYWGGTHSWLSIADMNNQPVISRTKEAITDAGAALFRGRRVEPGTVLLSFKLSLGKVAIAGIPLFTNEAIAALPVRDRTRVDSGYLSHYLRASDLTAGADRAAMGNTLNVPKLKALRVPLPPLPEQHRIAAILDQADALRTKRRHALEQLNTAEHALFRQNFGNVVENDKGWPTGRVSDFVHSFSTGKSVAAAASVDASKFRILKVSAVTRGVFRAEESKPLPIDYSPPASSFVSCGDLLFSRANTSDLIGATAYVWDDYTDLVLPDKLWRFNWCDTAEATPVFVWKMFSRPEFRKLISDRATGSSGSMKNISQSAVLGLPTILPPYDIRKSFETRVIELHNTRHRHARHLAKLDELFASLQHRAFRGEL